MSVNGDHPSDPPEYPMGIRPEDTPTEPEIRAGSWEDIARELANDRLQDKAWKREMGERLARLEHQIALIPKRDEQ
jgi:hypothetical protein